MPPSSKAHQVVLIVTCWLGGIATCLLFLQYSQRNCQSLAFPSKQEKTLSEISLNGIKDDPKEVTKEALKEVLKELTKEVPKEATTPAVQKEKPILLVWVWPENFRFDLSDCQTYYNIDGCRIIDDRNLYNQADAVLIFHKAISWDLSNLPPSPRPPFQRWIWFHVESPTNTHRIPGLENLFNLTLSYRRDADISVRYPLTVSKTPIEGFQIPKKDKLLCWFVSNTNPSTGTGTRMKFYEEFKKHINIDIFGNMAGKRLKDEEYFPTMSSCKFYLSLENSIHKDYITEKFNGPVSVGTVPVVLGPPRENYEQFAPHNSFIHVNDFASPLELANYLLQLDKDDEAYSRYFEWRKHVTATRHLTTWNQEFVTYICHACEYIGVHKEYKEAHDIYKWYFS
ncbi:4-galactosyl-N-acetylglucosaminide 3-alpha-L-fucosyltransferase 9 [Astyanax mexicanus]|uniref:4-galactosyl-N-acetylglucosaminide 3-alpha-L-fucosyltransferase 9 n=1 Tax=Astyanax mexicanus TaxID=7994 RepID=UPI0020CB2F8E|nr:4-galactosyl-N-acetylglucosaminide 3-alpha-L-fucosyltransferase 9 [Astyanax mexicanus]XP_022540880.2 4-galactosyl-N-acetylglucosaminide 3-alpha-L-fucosyltransferase 9 [Astyanax mexicanus]XP_049337402.1 4-galactosyl-N-acetylglucosaminide 3-alpha-L-fucosyltransferase 9 [Astyanax mexicanus]